MRRNIGSSVYLPVRLFSAVENRLAKRSIAGSLRVIPAADLVDVEVPTLKVIQYVSVALQSELRSRAIRGSIKLCVYDSLAPDAFAFMIDDLGVIVISIGTIAYNYHIASSLLATDVLVKYCHVPLPVSITTNNFRELRRDQNGFPQLELDEDRHFNAVLLSSLASAAIVLHEAGHIINGHCRLLASDPQFANRTDIRRALEHDADCYTVPGLVTFIRFMNDRGGQGLVTQGAAIICLAAAAAALPYCASSIGNVRDMGPDDGGPHHPPEGQRFWSILGVGQALLERGKVDSATAAQMMTGLNIALTEAAGLAFGIGNRLARGELERELTKRIVNTGEFIETWTELRPRLEPFKMGVGRLAPIQVRDRGLESGWTFWESRTD